VLQPKFTFSAPHLQLARGTLSALQTSIQLEDGEPFVASQSASGTACYILMVGGHYGDGAKAIGGAVQTVSALPSWTTEMDGILLWDKVNFCFYVSSGGSWKTIS
jgi:hypothetical protein